MKVDKVVPCVEDVRPSFDPVTYLLTPQGRRLSQPIVEEFAKTRDLLLCGRMGFDERLPKYFV